MIVDPQGLTAPQLSKSTTSRKVISFLQPASLRALGSGALKEKEQQEVTSEKDQELYYPTHYNYSELVRLASADAKRGKTHAKPVASFASPKKEGKSAAILVASAIASKKEGKSAAGPVASAAASKKEGKSAAKHVARADFSKKEGLGMIFEENDKLPTNPFTVPPMDNLPLPKNPEGWKIYLEHLEDQSQGHPLTTLEKQLLSEKKQLLSGKKP